MPQPDRVARRASPALRVFRDDDATPDGTCVRDHVHVMDPAEAPVAALVTVLDEAGHGSINIGIGIGTSVQELVDTYTCASGRALLFSIVGCPAGDVGSCCAEPQLAHEALHWPATRKLPQMFEDAYRHVDGATQ